MAQEKREEFKDDCSVNEWLGWAMRAMTDFY